MNIECEDCGEVLAPEMVVYDEDGVSRCPDCFFEHQCNNEDWPTN